MMSHLSSGYPNNYANNNTEKFNNYKDSSSSSSSSDGIPNEWMIFVFVSITILSCCLVRWCQPHSRGHNETERNPNLDDDAFEGDRPDIALAELDRRLIQSNFYTPSIKDRLRIRISELLINRRIFDCKGSKDCKCYQKNSFEKENVCLTCSSKFQENTCIICLDEYMKGDLISFSKNPACHHMFHQSCIIEWLSSRRSNYKCPCCRVNFLSSGKKENQAGVRSITTPHEDASELSHVDHSNEQYNTEYDVESQMTMSVHSAVGNDET